MYALYSKVAALVLLAVFTVLFGVVPAKFFTAIQYDRNTSTYDAEQQIKIRKRRRLADLIIMCFLYFGGGVLVATCFIHMLPEVREEFEEARNSGHVFLTEDYPWAELMVCIGFFLVYAIELIVHSFLCDGKLHHHSHSVGSCPPTGQTAVAETMLCPESGASSPDVPERAFDIEHSSKPRPKYGSMESISISAQSRGNEGSANLTLSSFRGVLIITALSFHSVFEGMAIGFQKTDSEVWTLFSAIAVHKFVIAFCVGLELMVMGTRLVVLTAQMLIFALVSPLGVGIGAFIMESYGDVKSSSLVVGVFQGLAAGTLIYVTFFEVLLKDKSKQKCAYLKLFCILTGFTAIAATHVLEK